jgi:mercuric ion binding protein
MATKTMRRFFMLAAVALLVPAAAPAGEMTIRLEIEGMHCALCGSAVSKALSEVEGVKNVSVSADDKQAVVVADESVTAESLTAAIAGAGFSATVEQRD